MIKELVEKRKFVEVYNKLVKKTVPEYWKFNQTIVFMSPKEINDIPRSKLRKYAILRFYDWSKVLSHLDNTFQKIEAPMFEYVKAEGKKPEYQIFLFNTNYNFGVLVLKSKKKRKIEKELRESIKFNPYYSEENIITTLMLVQKHLNYILSKKKVMKFYKYALAEAKKNCKELDGKKVLIQKADIQTKIVNNANEFYKKGTIVAATPQQIKDAITQQKDILIGFPHTKKIMAGHDKVGLGSGISLSVGGSKGIFNKLIVNPSTWKIVAFLKVSGMTNFPDFRKRDFKKLNSCKF